MKLKRSKVDIILSKPFFASLLFRLEMHEDPACPTAWTDGTKMGYNPEYFKSLSEAEIKGIICHEIMHCALKHMTRRQHREMMKWNQACDYAINLLIKDEGLELPDGALLEEQYRNKSAEEIYNIIPEQNDKGTGCGEVRDAKDGEGKSSESNNKKVETDWQIAVSQAANAAKMQGKLSAGMQRFVNEIVNPKAPWQELLRRFVNSTAKNEYRWMPPNKRYIHRDIYLPSLKSEELGEIIIAVDTSGSIDTEMLNQFNAEVNEIIELYKPKVKFICCDSEIASVEEHEEQFTMKPKGGGGTAFSPVFEYVEQNEINPVCLIYFTDMCCNDFGKEPEYPVLWLQTGEYGRKAPFGEVIKI